MERSEAVTSLGALAQESRLSIFRTLVEAGPDGLPAGALAEVLRIPSPTLSFHLQQLSHAGLVEKRRSSRQLIYSVDIAAMNALIGFLTDACCGGRPELCLPEQGCAPSPPARSVSRKST
jgi:ArsR family transcriptional regulator